MTRAFASNFEAYVLWMDLKPRSFTEFPIFFRFWLRESKCRQIPPRTGPFYLKNRCRAGIQPSDTATSPLRQ
ncbi:MAG: hypothetical protein DWH99_04945 [Planctomycetota bacterium]|nr:MAG: hypothetical protein DWH99_04945 [Planctomycetota bacterium]